MLVKICGIKTITAAHAAIEAGADWLGFVFAPSKRQISPEQAAAIVKTVPSSVRTVGVFVNEDVVQMNNVAAQVGLHMIQLHGDESPSVAHRLPYQVIKAFSIDRIDLATITSFPCDYYLIDSPRTTFYGGSGQPFDWEAVHELPINQNKVILAGGLTPENVQHAIHRVNPVGVDVSSGVETNGVKDGVKIEQFINQAKVN